MATRAGLEATIVSFVGPWLVNVGMAVTTVGANASLNDAIGWAIMAAGGTVADPALITDADVQTVTDYYKLAALTELRTLESILSNFTGTDIKAGPVEIKDSQFGTAVLARLAALRLSILNTYGIGGVVDSFLSASIAHTVVW